MNSDRRYPAITIARRFRGPPRSANGGYVAGRLAALVGTGAEVTLRAPPPLDEPLEPRPAGDGSVALYAGERLLAEARPAVADSPGFAVPTLAAARAAQARSFPPERHRIPGCFVCGPAREVGDGLRLHVGPLAAGDRDWSGLLAAEWRPGEDLAGSDGLVRTEFLWAALDCPTAYACGTGDGMPPILLGRQTVSVHARPRPGESLVVVARSRGREGRKHFAEAALYAADGRELAAGQATWIEVDLEAIGAV